MMEEQKNYDLEDQFRDRRFTIALLLICVALAIAAALLFVEIPEANQVTFGVVIGIVFEWATGAVKAFFKLFEKTPNAKK